MGPTPHNARAVPPWAHRADFRGVPSIWLSGGIRRCVYTRMSGELALGLRPQIGGDIAMCQSNRSIVAVSQDGDLADLLDALLGATNDYDVVVVESMARGYSRIKQLAPDAIIVFVDMEDPAVCQLLSMLTADRDTLDIPIVTWTKRPSLLHPPSQASRTALAA